MYSEFGVFTLTFQAKVELQGSGGGDELTGLTASFGAPFPTEAEKGFKYPAVFSNPLNCCSSLPSQVNLRCICISFSYFFLPKGILGFYEFFACCVLCFMLV